MELGNRDVAFMFLGYAGVLLRTSRGSIAIDVADLLSAREIAAVENLDLLLFTHVHGDHYKANKALRILKKTDAHIIADVRVAEDLKNKVPEDRLTLGDPGRLSNTYKISDFKVDVIFGLHAGPLNIYRVKLGNLSVFHAGDSSYIRVSNFPSPIAFLPTGAPSHTCAPEVALAMALDLNPKIAVATHGTKEQMIKFKQLVERDLPETAVVIPRKFEAKKLTL